MEKKVYDATIALKRLDGDVELFGMLIAIFHEDSVELFAKLTAGLAGGDLTQVERAAHSLKGLAANFEANETTEVAAKVEGMARAGQTAGLEENVSRLGVRLAKLRDALARWNAD